MSLERSVIAKNPHGLCRRFGYEPKSCEGDIERIQKALVHGLFANAVVFDKTEYDDAQKHHTGQDVYRLIHSTGPGVSHSHGCCFHWILLYSICASPPLTSRSFWAGPTTCLSSSLHHVLVYVEDRVRASKAVHTQVEMACFLLEMHC